MAWGDVALNALDIFNHELMLFAAIGFLVGGIDDVAVDLVFGWQALRHRRRGNGERLERLPGPEHRLAVFVPAWDEAAVIGAMLQTALARFDHPDFDIYVGTYPNDTATIDAVRAIADRDARVRLVIGDTPGPTTKAACLNTLWHALQADTRRSRHVHAVVLHDAEDVVHRNELRVFDALTRRYDAVQLPVLPLVDKGSRLVSGHYCDEFAIAHSKHLPVRQSLGAALPFAGVGCAIRTDMLARIAALRNGEPFDAGSLTEDYELGLTVARLGGTARFARIRTTNARGASDLVAVRAFFPGSLDAAVRQKARWMTGIALVGWDRTGWARPAALGDHWMRMRDRRGLVAMLVLAAGYLGLIGWALGVLGHALVDRPIAPVGPVVSSLLAANAVLLAWRLALRACFVGHAYGATEALWSLPRAIVANIIALLATRRALFSYVALLRGGALTWDKTAHRFPETARLTA